MKFKNYFYLCRNDFKSDKALKHTSLSITLCFILLISVLWLTISFYGDAQTQLKKYSFNNLYTVDYSLDDTVRDTPYPLYAREEGQKFARKVAAKSTCFVQNYAIQTAVGDVNFKTDLLNFKDHNRSVTLKIFQNVPSITQIILPAYTDYLCAGGVRQPAMVGGGFYGDGRGQIIISSRIAEALSIDTAMQKKLSLDLQVGPSVGGNKQFDYDLPGVLDNDADTDNAHPFANPQDHTRYFEGGSIKIFENYEVVGIFNEALLASNLQSAGAELWICEVSLKGNSGMSYLPTIKVQSIYSNKYLRPYDAAVITYADSDVVSLSKKATKDSAVFPFFIAGGYVSPYVTRGTNLACENMASLTPIISTQYEIKSYSNLKELYSDFKIRFLSNLKGDDRFAPINATMFKVISISETYDPFLLFGTVLSIVLGISAIIFFLSVIMFHIKRREKFTGMMRAVGLEKDGVSKLYFAQTIYAFLRSFAIGAMIAFLISLAIFLVVGNLAVNAISAPFSLNLWYFPLSAILTFIVFLVPCLLFIAVKCHKICSKSIASTLKSNATNR